MKNITDNFNIRRDLEIANYKLDAMEMSTDREHETLTDGAVHSIIAVLAEMRNEIAQLQRVVERQSEEIDALRGHCQALDTRTIGSMRLGSA